MWILLMILYSNILPLYSVNFNPHQPHNLTWQVINGVGDVIWSQSKYAIPYTWWPNLFPDICKMSIGVSSWDLEGHSDAEKASSSCTEEWAHRTNPWGGCCNSHWRSLLRTQSFYVCPGFHRYQALDSKCGGKSDFFCKSWGCETSGQAYWKPTSSWDYIKVTANYTMAPYVPGGSHISACTTWCHPLRIVFTKPGKKANLWTKGYEWGLRMYIDSYDHGLLFTIKLKIDNPHASVGPNKVLAPVEPIKPKPEATVIPSVITVRAPDIGPDNPQTP